VSLLHNGNRIPRRAEAKEQNSKSLLLRETLLSYLQEIAKMKQ